MRKVRSILLGVLFAVTIGLPAVIVLFGAIAMVAGLFESGQQRSDTLAGGLFIVIFGLALGVPVIIFFLRRRRRRRGRSLEDLLFANDRPPAADPQTAAELDAIFGPPIVPPPVAVILPFSLRSRPWNKRPWWLAPLALVGYPTWETLRHQAFDSTTTITLFASAALGTVIAALQYRYVFRRRIVVDDLNVTYVNMWGRATAVPRAEIKQIALRTIFSRQMVEDRLFLLGSDGRSVLRVPRFGLTYDEASELAAVLRIPIDRSWDRPARLEALDREIPGSATWPERHSVLVALAIMIPILATVIGLAILFPTQH